MDSQIKEYFDFGPLTAEKPIMNVSTAGKIIVIGIGLKDQFSKFLKVSPNQIVVPDKLSKALMSYIYKTNEERNDKELSKLILQRLNLKIQNMDTLMEVMQLDIVDKGLFKKYALAADGQSNLSGSSWSAVYAAISNDSFTPLKTSIEGAFNTVVVFKEEGTLKGKCL